MGDGFPKYYEWYTKNVSIEEIKMIYTKYGINFYDILEQNDFQKVNNNKTRTLKKQGIKKTDVFYVLNTDKILLYATCMLPVCYG